VRREKPKKGHKPNMAQKRKRERYRMQGRLRRNKLRNIGRMLVTASGQYREYLEDRIDYWKSR